MWIWDDSQQTLLNLASMNFLTIHRADAGVGVMAHREQRDMGVLVKVCDSEDEARKFIGSLGAKLNDSPRPRPEPKPAFE